MLNVVLAAPGPPPAELTDLEPIFANIVSLVLGFGGLTLFIMLVIGGFKYITAGGEPEKIGEAKKTITYAIFGLVFVASAYLIIVLIATFTGVTGITVFQIRKGS